MLIYQHYYFDDITSFINANYTYIHTYFKILASRIQSSWPNPGYWPGAAEVRCAAALVTSGHVEDGR